MQKFKNQAVSDREFTITSKEVFSFGPDLDLHRCVLRLKGGSRSLIFSRVKVFDSLIHITSKFKNVDWHHAFFERCRFQGDIQGNDFGRRTESLWWSEAGIKACDFSEANLDGCRFYNTDIEEVRLPVWPCFTVPDPVKYFPRLWNATWPDGLSSAWAKSGPQPPGLSFLVMNAEVEIHHYGGKLESFLHRLKEFPFVYIREPEMTQ